MKRLILSLTLVLLLVGCARRKEIDDKTLAQIFRDAYLTNAYLGVDYMELDSIQIYEPILESYGFTPEDLRYTIGNFSRRKSAQLGRVLKDAEEQISKMATIYDKKVVILDTIKNVAVRRMKRPVYTDWLRVIKKMSDSTKLNLVVENLQPGMYSIRYKYIYKEPTQKSNKKSSKGSPIDRTMRGVLYVETHSESHRNNYSYNLRAEENIRRTLTTDTSANRLVITFAKPADARHKPRKIDLEVSDIEIIYTPDDNLAIDSLFKKYIDIKIFDDIFFTNPTDSLALPADTTRVL